MKNRSVLLNALKSHVVIFISENVHMYLQLFLWEEGEAKIVKKSLGGQS